MTKEMKQFLYQFVDLGYAIENLIKENETLEEENQRLREENQSRFKQIMDMAHNSHEGVKDFIKAILNDEIIINVKNTEE